MLNSFREFRAFRGFFLGFNLDAEAFMDPPITAPQVVPADTSIEGADDQARPISDPGREDRLWLGRITVVLAELRALDEGEVPSRLPDRVLYARDRALIALCERIARTARRDLPVEPA